MLQKTACEYGHYEIVVVILRHATIYNIDLNATDLCGYTGFHIGKSNY